MKYLSLLSFLLLLVGCADENNVEAEIDKIPMDVDIVRFDQLFFEASPADLPSLKAEYPLFFPEQFEDSVWVERMNDTLQRELQLEVNKVFPGKEKIEDDLVPLFQHIKYYFPEFVAPTVYTVISDVDYQNKVIAANDLLVIGLDTYLGSDHHFYEGIQQYISKNLKPSQLAPDVASEYALQLIVAPKRQDLLSWMVLYGKELYLKDLWLPNTTNGKKIGYTEEEMQWAYNNEEEIWRYFVEKELLFSTDSKLPMRFIHEAPFSKFYLPIDNESPGMIGRFIGWQIVRAYMENSETTPQQLLLTDAETIFNNSKYKPKK